MRRRFGGWILAVSGVLACPCHLVITLPLALALLSGTALGGWIATHEGTIAGGATIYFVGALGVGALLLMHTRGGQPGQRGQECAWPSAGNQEPDAIQGVCRVDHSDDAYRARADEDARGGYTAHPRLHASAALAGESMERAGAATAE